VGKIKLCRVAGVDDAAVRESDRDAGDGGSNIDERGVDWEEMASAASVGDVGGESGVLRGGTWANSRAIWFFSFLDYRI
jgi:hypothetical protein